MQASFMTAIFNIAIFGLVFYSVIFFRTRKSDNEEDDILMPLEALSIPFAIGAVLCLLFLMQKDRKKARHALLYGHYFGLGGLLIMTFCAIFKWFKTGVKNVRQIENDPNIDEPPIVRTSIKIKDVDIHGSIVFATFAVLYALYLWFIDIADLYVLEREEPRSRRQVDSVAA